MNEMEPRTLRAISTVTGRPPATVWALCRDGLLPERLRPESNTGRRGTVLPAVVAEQLVTVFAEPRLVTPGLARLIGSEPAKARRFLAALEQLAELAEEEQARGPAAMSA